MKINPQARGSRQPVSAEEQGEAVSLFITSITAITINKVDMYVYTSK